jgi:uncharacterized cofD-like protein
MNVFKWLYPGMKVKRWLFLLILGVLFLLAGFTATVNIGILNVVETFVMKMVRRVSDQSLIGSPLVTGLLVMVLGVFCMAFGIRGIVRSVVTAIYPCDGSEIAGLVHHKRQLGRGPRIVVIGGGTGLPVLLRGLKKYTSNLTAIVTVADDGGSSGKLRNEWGVLPPGDIRNCLVALATTEPLMERLFQHRFSNEQGLEGHSFGNIFIATMSEITGDFEAAVRASSKVLAIQGRVLPSTLEKVTLCAETEDGRIIKGESSIPTHESSIKRVFLEPASARALPEALDAIESADAIILSPGSLYTSIMPNLLVQDVKEAIRRSKALKMYVCNIMTQHGETDEYSVFDHVDAIVRHTCSDIIEYVLINNQRIPARLLAKYKEEKAFPVVLNSERIKAAGYVPVMGQFLSKSDIIRHDPAKIAQVIINIVNRHRTVRHIMANLNILKRNKVVERDFHVF